MEVQWFYYYHPESDSVWRSASQEESLIEFDEIDKQRFEDLGGMFVDDDFTTITAYTDGSAVVRGVCKGNGGFGTFFPNYFGKLKAYSLGFKDTKTGRMEIMALYHAINAIPKNRKDVRTLRVFSDSEYVVKSFTEGRLERWIQAGWRNTSGEVKNKDLWKCVLKALNERSFMKLDIRHIRSHQVEKAKTEEEKSELLECPNIRGNRVADALADYKRHKELKEFDKIVL